MHQKGTQLSRRLHQVLTIFQLIIASGAWILIETAHSKMGVSRHLYYMNQKVDAAIQFENLSIILGVPLMVVSVVFLVKTLKVGKSVALSHIVMIAYTLFTSVFILRNTTSTEVAYYYVMLLMLVFIGIQIAKVSFGKTDTIDVQSKSYKVIHVILLSLSLFIFLR